MQKEVQMAIRLTKELHQKATYKCKNEFHMCLGTLIKLFLKSFISQEGIGFQIGDEQFYKLFNKWLRKKEFEIERKTHYPGLGPTLKELYDF